MKIYDFPAFPNPLRVRIALAEKGLTDEVTFELVDVPNGAHRKPDFLAKNPDAAVPLLELEDGTLISECASITEYVDHKTGEPTLTGKTPKDRAVISMMQRRAEQGLLDAVAIYFHHATPGLGPDIETDQVPEWGERQRTRALKGMRYLNEVLTKQPYLAGEDFTIADITAYAGLVFADFAKIDVPTDCPALSEWRSRVASRPSIAA